MKSWNNMLLISGILPVLTVFQGTIEIKIISRHLAKGEYSGDRKEKYKEAD